MALPRHIADDVILRYADILRVGRLRFNGELLAWSTDGTTQRQLQAFVEVLLPQLEHLPEVVAEALDGDELGEVLLCICKAVSINYVLFDVLNLLRNKTGKVCSIDSRTRNGGNAAEYFVDARPGLRFDAGIAWSTRNNVVACVPGSSSTQKVGTLSRVQTGFSWISDPLNDTPGCKVTMSLRRPLLSRILTLGCKCASASRDMREWIPVDEPLCTTPRRSMRLCSIASTQTVPAPVTGFLFGNGSCKEPDDLRAAGLRTTSGRSWPRARPTRDLQHEECTATPGRRSWFGRRSFMKLLRRRRNAAESCPYVLQRD